MLEKFILGLLLVLPIVSIFAMLCLYNFGMPDPQNNKALSYATFTLVTIVGFFFYVFGFLDWYINQLDMSQAFLEKWYFLKSLPLIVYIFFIVGYFIGIFRVDISKDATFEVCNFLGVMLVAVASGVVIWQFWEKFLQPILSGL